MNIKNLFYEEVPDGQRSKKFFLVVDLNWSRNSKNCYIFPVALIMLPVMIFWKAFLYIWFDLVQIYMDLKRNLKKPCFFCKGFGTVESYDLKNGLTSSVYYRVPCPKCFPEKWPV